VQSSIQSNLTINLQFLSKNLSFSLVSSAYFFRTDLEKICRGESDSLDQVIFDLFDLTGTGLVSGDELSQMLLNLPLDGIIVHNNSNSKSKLSLMSTASNHTQGGSSAAIINYCQYSI
jgi:hypothetical protein